MTRSLDTEDHQLTLWRLTKAQLRVLLAGRSTGWGTIAVLLLALVSGTAAGTVGLSPSVRGSDPLPVVNTAIMFSSVGLHLYCIGIGADAIAGDFARGTIRTWLAVSPRRSMFFAAKIAAICGFAVVVGFLTGIVAGGSTLFMGTLLDDPPNVTSVLAWLAMTNGLAIGAGILTLLALAIGTLARQRLVAILIPIATQFIIPLLIGTLLSGAPRDWIYAALPGSAMTALTTARIQDGDVILGMTISDTVGLSFWAAMLILAIWCALVVPWATIAFLRHDLTRVSNIRMRAPRRIPTRATLRQHQHLSTAGGRLRSELRKSWSLPSVRWILAIAVLIELGFGIARAASGNLENVSAHSTEAIAIEFSYAITGGIGGLALLLAVLMSIQIAGEFETGTAVSTYIASPRRWQVTSAKLITAAISSVAIGLPGILLTVLVVVPIYARRGYPVTIEVFASGTLTALEALLFLLLTALMCAGIAGLTRHGVATIIVVAILLMIGPALLNTLRGFALQMGSPLVVIGNGARLFPWEGARFFYPAEDATIFAMVDGDGILQVSAGFGITMTALWAAAAVVAWLVMDIKRPISVR